MKSSTIVLVLVVLIVIAAGLYTFIQARDRVEGMPGGVACTADAMLCPDGSYVGRSGPNCEFVCPTATSTPAPVVGGGGGTGTGGTGGGQGIMPYNSGIRGTVMAGPTCPVERDPPDPNCADRPTQTNVSVYRAQDITRSLGVTTSSAQGTFEFSLPPGNYVIMAGPYGVPFPSCSDTPATVAPNSYTSVVVQCDTGIR